jgi:hypothetical protein
VSDAPLHGPSVAEFEIAPGPTAPGAARRALGLLTAALPPSVADDLRLIASELVTYGLLNRATGEEPLTLRLARGDGTTRLEIAAGRGSADIEGAALLGRDDGAPIRLKLISVVADRWGVETRDGVVVWLEIDDRAIDL